MEIRSAQETDIDAILSLQEEIYRVNDKSSDSVDLLTKQLKTSECVVLVAEKEGEVVGTATIYYIQVAVRGRPYALLEGLVVDKSQRHHGIGSTLFNFCVDTAKKNNCYKMIFTSGSDRTDAHEFYEKLGFKKWGLEFRKDL